MVYQGKPSGGCANCRKRKIKCDELRPACSRCLNTRRVCPGYVARFDLVLRDQTRSVRRKALDKKISPPSAVGRSSFRVYMPPQASSPPASTSSEDSVSSYHILAGTGEEPSYATIKKAKLDNHGSIPRLSDHFPEQEAICAFFLDFVLLPRHPDSFRGHLEHLLPLYQGALPNSPIALATSSVALSLSSNPHNCCSDRQLARNIFGRALRKTSNAIRDPVDSLKDETLMAVLLLGLYERINASPSATSQKPSSNHTEPTPPSASMTSTHNEGAAALVKHRGVANVKSPVAIGLLFAVRTQLVEHAIEQGQSFKRCPDGLSRIFAELPQNAAARLTSATTNIADLRSCAKTALHQPRSAASEREVTDLLEYAISIDLLVAAWPESLPENWQWTPATEFDHPGAPSSSPSNRSPQQRSKGLSSDQPSTPYTYRGSKDIYLDLWVMSIWNQYRAARIKIQALILSCIAYLGVTHEASWYWRKVYARMIAQQMADEICASVPFALGTMEAGSATAAEERKARDARNMVDPPLMEARAASSTEPEVAATWSPAQFPNLNGSSSSSSPLRTEQTSAIQQPHQPIHSTAHSAAPQNPPPPTTPTSHHNPLPPPSSPPTIEYPYAPPAYPRLSPQSPHHRAAASVGGWHLIDPLRTIINAPRDSRTPDALHDGQREWCVGQMERVGRVWGLGAGGGKSGGGGSHGEEGVVEWGGGGEGGCGRGGEWSLLFESGEGRG
ncbi:MAG: hypothetical protein OHK93_005379 [Ramalina farinacea]|uniref:Zn(2)-C6 fungal-type domain-containing protein n=1 Tax=Ramalina farinacea TaxID=258253 RepID=A0AA43QVY6_9LECA|nr:hypothetical protein [Ramalina farinacea]